MRYDAAVEAQLSVGDIQVTAADVHLLSITWEDEPSAVRGFWNRHGGAWPVATDPRMRTGQAFGVETVPTMLLFDPEGTRVWRDTGLASVDAMTTAIERARA